MEWSTLGINICFFLQGISALLVWNTFIMLDTYFKGRFANPKVGESVVFILALFIQVPNFVFAWTNLFLERFRNNLTRIVSMTSCVILIGLQILTVIFYFDMYISTDVFIAAVFGLVILMTAANSIFQNAIYGLASIFTPSSTLSIVLGSNVSGCIVAVFMILAKIFSFKMFNHTMAFFLSVNILLMLNIIIFSYTVKRTEFKNALKNNNGIAERVPYNPVYRLSGQPLVPYPTFWVVEEAKVSICTVFITFLTSLTIFPAIMSNVKSSDPDFKFFTEITCFLGFNLFATLGVIVAAIYKIKAKALLSLALVRIAFIPLFLLCNYQPSEEERRLPVYFYSNYIYYTLVILMSFTSGYSSSLGMIYISKEGSNDPKKAGLIGGVTLISGILAGIVFSGVMPMII